MSPPGVVSAVARFLAGEGPPEGSEAGAFEQLALQAFAYQYREIPAYRRLCDGRGATPGRVGRWQKIPAVPALAFKSVTLATAPAQVVFRSSGTSAGQERRSYHHQPFPQLYRAGVRRSFPLFCLPPELPADPRLPILSLIPEARMLPDSSLSFMADLVLATWGAPPSATALDPSGLLPDRAAAWAEAVEAAGRPALVLATALALASWLDALESSGRRWTLPTGTVFFETGGFKGQRREVARQDLLARIQEHLGIPPERVVREYGMTELSSQFYTRILHGGDPDLFVGPPWTRVRLLDPETLQEAAPGRAGLVTVMDLANAGSAIHVMTEDLGIAESGGFRLLGRASGAELRGCSLTAEALAEGGVT